MSCVSNPRCACAAAAASVGSATSHVRFLPKPFDADELLTVLEEAIERDRTLISQRS